MLNSSGKNLMKLVGFHLGAFLLSFFIFLVFFQLGLGKNLVLFYRGMIFIILISVFLAVMIVLLKKKTSWGKFLTYRDMVLCVTLFACLTMLIFTHLPVTVERSVSVFLLKYMAEHPEEIMTKESAEQLFIDQYVQGRVEIQKRFDEQIFTGNIIANNDGYQLSPAGKKTVTLFDFMETLFALRKYRH